MDTLEYITRMSAKIQASFESGENMPWADRVAAASSAISDEDGE